jgi:hypothetical protein
MRKPGVRQPEEFTKSQLKAMLAEAAPTRRDCLDDAFNEPVIRETIRSMDVVAIGTVVLTSRRRRTAAGMPRKTVRR